MMRQGERSLDEARGPTGPRGPKGDTGETGAPAVSLWAVVDQAGVVMRGKGLKNEHEQVWLPNPGEYEVEFDRNVEDCAYVGGTGDGESPSAPLNHPVLVYTTGGNTPNSVIVRTFLSPSTPVPASFVLQVAC